MAEPEHYSFSNPHILSWWNGVVFGAGVGVLTMVLFVHFAGYHR